MNLPVRLLPEAKAEFDAAADWYEQKRAGLGIDFVTRVREVLNRISANPQLHPMVYGDVRKAMVRRFPYVVLLSGGGRRSGRDRRFPHGAGSRHLAIACLGIRWSNG